MSETSAQDTPTHPPARTGGPVRIVGAGLLGASIGQALVGQGVDVILADNVRSTVALAVDYGAGRVARQDDRPAFVIVAVPPDATASVVADELARWPAATVTDVASVKAPILAELAAAEVDVGRYVGSHPLAGRERGGPISARADLFEGRPWVVTGSDPARRRQVEDLVLDLGGIPILMSADEHDASVGLISHVPQLIASLLARRLVGASEGAMSLAGQGLRDTTRIAASDPHLWVQILAANAASISGVLSAYRADLDAALDALNRIDRPGARKALAELLAGGTTGVSRIPGKHGRSERYSRLIVQVDDRPGELARLLADIGRADVNMEDLRLEHSPRAQIGLAEISVVPEAADRLTRELTGLGWKIAEESA